MEFRQLGKAGLRISAVGLGCNPFGNEVDEPGAAAIVNTAIDAGVTYFYNLLYRDIEKRMEPYCIKHGLAMIPYFPLAGGLLSGAYQRGVSPEAGSRGAIRPTFRTWDTPRNWDIQEKLAAFAQEHGWTL